MAAVDVVQRYVEGLPGSTRRNGPAEWGVTVEAEAAGGWPLDIGLRIADGLLRAQTLVTRFDEMLDPWLLLHWNRQTRMVRFAAARNGDVWVHGDVPVAAVDELAVDKLLGLVAEGATVGRRYAAEAAAARNRGETEVRGDFRASDTHNSPRAEPGWTSRPSAS